MNFCTAISNLPMSWLETGTKLRSVISGMCAVSAATLGNYQMIFQLVGSKLLKSSLDANLMEKKLIYGVLAAFWPKCT